MLGAIIGDICGSIYEREPVKREDFALLEHKEYHDFTDETVMLTAIAEVYLLNRPNYYDDLSDYVNFFPLKPYSAWFRHWATSSSLEPYNSYGNGAASRVCSLGFLAQSEFEALEEARYSAKVTHSHPEGIKGAQAVALGIYLASRNASKTEIKERIEKEFGYNLSRTLVEIRKNYRFDITAQGSVPEAFIAFFESRSFVTAIENAILLRGDADTQACIAGALAEAYYKQIPYILIEHAMKLLPEKIKGILELFYERYAPLAEERNIKREKRLFRTYRNPLKEKPQAQDIQGQEEIDCILYSRGRRFLSE